MRSSNRGLRIRFLFEPRLGPRDVHEFANRDSSDTAALDDTEGGTRLRAVEMRMNEQGANSGEAAGLAPDWPIQGIDLRATPVSVPTAPGRSSECLSGGRSLEPKTDRPATDLLEAVSCPIAHRIR